jgi:hypothetical protein
MTFWVNVVDFEKRIALHGLQKKDAAAAAV